MSGHTPGPWYAWDSEAMIGIGKQYGNEADLFHVAGESNRNRSEDLANANLIAAAPDLLEALEYLLSSYSSFMSSEFDFPGDPWTPEGSNDKGAILAIKAIARAKGEK